MKHILFIGDSITESGKQGDLDNIGNGYVRIIHDYLKTVHLTEQIKITNKGISGNRISDLAARWREDVLELNPDILSISIGINDVWRQIDNPQMKQIHPAEFEMIYNDLLTQVRSKTDASIVLMEPTIIEEDVHSQGNKKLVEYVEIVNGLAEKFEAIVVPSHLAFLGYLNADRNYNVTIDGVHMNSAGNMLMAATWLEAAKGLLDKQ
ncbi:hydrolase [Virgibacillus indicus]|uniref:Hydrolase n=1 Tax=Virgibacillus indicus TaxID=2024554 RepID=A0A265N911_9BACI|nr:SGNH/GDSL hydrolase family protein [Virgibacillus indicus]OZU88305.1 hydrolase [Virgibacillus indicus]